MIKPIQVTSGIWRGPQPVGPEDWLMLTKLGIKYTLDLETGARLLNDGSPLHEAVTAEQYGIKCYNHPLGEILPPSADELRQACALAVGHYPIYIHCKAGVDRTGMVIAHLLMYWRGSQDAWTKSAAVADMKKAGMHFWYYWWSWFL